MHSRSIRRRTLVSAALGIAMLSAACSAPDAPASNATPPAGTATTAATATADASGTRTSTPAAATLVVQGAWARSTPGNPNENSAGYGTITNKGTQADRLVGASVPAEVAGTVELHRTVRAGDVMRMEPVSSFEIAPGATLTLEPGGNHIMFLRLPTALQAGTKIPVTLRFERAAPMTVDFEVRSATGSMGGMQGMGGTPAAQGTMQPGGMQPGMQPGGMR